MNSKSSNQIDIGLTLRIQQIDNKRVKKIHKRYNNKTQDWSQFKQKVKNYNPFYYTQKAANYPSNKAKWFCQKHLIKKSEAFEVYISFYEGKNSHRERKNMSAAVAVRNSKCDSVLQRCYYIGCKEPSYGCLIGLTQILVDLQKLGFKKIIINCDHQLFEDFLDNKFKNEDPYQEKTSDILQKTLLKFSSVKANKKINQQIIEEVHKLAEWVQEFQMRSFLQRYEEAQMAQQIIDDNPQFKNE